MDIKIATEQEMRDGNVPTFDTLEELNTYITTLETRSHDYATAAYTMSMAATATFNYMAFKLGVTGFQASCADLDVLRRTRNLTCPFKIIKADDMLYPQYDIPADVNKTIEKWEQWAAEAAEKLIAATTYNTHPRVMKHWQMLAAKKTTTPK